MPETSLGKLFYGCGITDWEEVVKDICKKCQFGHLCAGAYKCDAILVIGILGTKAVKHMLDAHVFATDLKHSIKKVHAN